ncbi:hypothetical protein KSP39_PZI003293 [Platanthera zijinensis]|uniref:CCHC-type domain-containing protein n=1 Tax=Platanthera zijinensis TaxID=2320716 RepID=A0AAP0GD25_9ASPA
MEVDEDVDSMYTRFSKIINDSKILGKSFSNGDLVRKILRSLPPKFNPKVSVISESHDLKTLQIENLIGNLKTHEVELRIQQQEYNVEPRKKALALKSKKVVESEFDEDEEEDEESLKRKAQADGEDDEERPPPECYHCRKIGHIKSKCPKYLKELKEKRRKKKDKKKVLKAETWDDVSSEESSSLSSETEEEANMCLMGKGVTTTNCTCCKD